MDDITLGGIFGGLIYGFMQSKKSVGTVLISTSLGGVFGLLGALGMVST